MMYLIDSELAAAASILLAARAAFLRQESFYITDREGSAYHAALAKKLLPQREGGLSIEILRCSDLQRLLGGEGVALDLLCDGADDASVGESHAHRLVHEFAQKRLVLVTPRPIDYGRVFSVDGDRAFPVDLLREFSCVPMTPQDAGRIEQSVQERAGQVGWRIALVRLDMTTPIRAEAWEDAGWKIVGEPLHGGQPESSGEPT
jgi:hypothetical protein